MADLDFTSRRSVVVSVNGCVASSNPLASQTGLEILKAGGNAADAAVAVAAVLNVTEPMSTGLGGDTFCLFYNNETKTVKGLNGSGRSPHKMTLDYVNGCGFNKETAIPSNHGLSVTVPGAASAWIDTVNTWGSGHISLTQILSPAIEMAENGFPVQEIAAYFWNEGAHLLQDPTNQHGEDLLLNGKAPRHGDVMKNPNLGKVFKALAKNGKEGFYQSWIANAIVDAVNQHGGVMDVDDLSNHTSTWVEPISTVYKGQRLWELPPNGHGMTALIALNILEGFDLKGMGHNSAMYLHHVAESLRLAFADTLKHCADPEHENIPLSRLLSKEYAAKLRQSIKTDGVIPASRLKDKIKEAFSGSDTVYFTVADRHGNACSFINSNFEGFGTGIVPKGCGFTLQNRGRGFSLVPSHPNVLKPWKRPYHTIIPAMLTDEHTGDLVMSFGVMGGYMQPQGHVQVLLNMLEFGCNPQQALDKSRLCLGNGYSGESTFDCMFLEEGIQESVVTRLKSLGHENIHLVKGSERNLFGRGQIISKGKWWSKDMSDGPVLYWAGSDPRSDGSVAAY